jgi:hypothetical protein
MTRKNEWSGRVPEWLVERLAAGDLPAARAAEVRRRLALEPDGPARLETITTSNHEILAAHPPAVISEQIHRRVGQENLPSSKWLGLPTGQPRLPRTKQRRWAFTFGVPTVALAALGLALWLRTNPVRPVDGRGGVISVAAPASDDGDQIKGLQPGLRVYRKVGDAVERLPSGATAHAGDQLQLAYVASGRRFGAVVSVDGAGHVTFHLPVTAGPAARLRTDGEIALPDAYELDAAPGFERFVFAAADARFDASSLADVARGKAPASTLAGAVVVSFTVRKE